MSQGLRTSVCNAGNKLVGGALNLAASWTTGGVVCNYRKNPRTKQSGPPCIVNGKIVKSGSVVYNGFEFFPIPQPTGGCFPRKLPKSTVQVAQNYKSGTSAQRRQVRVAAQSRKANSPAVSANLPQAAVADPDNSRPDNCKQETILQAQALCEREKDYAVSQCEITEIEKNNFGTAYSSMGLGGAPGVLANCAYAADALLPLQNTVKQSNELCTTYKQECASKCSQFANTIQSCASHYTTADQAFYQQASAQVAGLQNSCGAIQAQIDKNSSDLEQIGKSLQTSLGCLNSVKEMSNGGSGANGTGLPPDISPCISDPNSAACTALGPQVCTNPAFAKTSRVCQCAANPTSDNCISKQSTAESSYLGGKAGGGGSVKSAGGLGAGDLAGGGNVNPAALVGTDKGSAGKAGDGPGGRKGNGANVGSNGGAGGGSVATGGGAGGDIGADMDILNGWRGGGNGATAFGSISEEEFAPTPSDSNALNQNPNLDEFRPDLAYDPKFNRGVAGVVGPDGIRGAYTNIFENMNEAYRKQKYNFVNGDTIKQK